MPDQLQRSAAVVLGGYVNAYGVVRSLKEAGVARVIIVDTIRSFATRSRLISAHYIIDSLEELPQKLLEIAVNEGYLVLYPTSDAHIEMLAKNIDVLSADCFVPFNPRTVVQASDKTVQYQAAVNRGVACPGTLTIASTDDWETFLDLAFPVLVKPARRVDQHPGQYRNMEIGSSLDASERKQSILAPLRAGTEIMASEIIPGGDENVFAYTSYRSPAGEILRSWCGKKLSQYPDAYGVFAGGTAVLDSELERVGRAVVDELDCYGITQPEFKLDPRDGQFKLMEVNLRSDMWNRTGAVAGVNIAEAQWLDATGQDTPWQHQQQTPVVYVYAGHEIGNLIARPGYRGRFLKNLKHGKLHWAFWNPRDPLPFLYSMKAFARLVVKSCLRRFTGS